jgi:hypothetical protein
LCVYVVRVCARGRVCMWCVCVRARAVTVPRARPCAPRVCAVVLPQLLARSGLSEEETAGLEWRVADLLRCAAAAAAAPPPPAVRECECECSARDDGLQVFGSQRKRFVCGRVFSPAWRRVLAAGSRVIVTSCCCCIGDVGGGGS